MKTSLRIIACMALFAFAAPALVAADEKPAAAPAAPAAPAKEKSKYTPLYAQVDSITDSLLTVKGSGPKISNLSSTPKPKITKDKAHKETATAADVKVGQWIGGSYTKAADGSNVLHSLHLGVSQKRAKQPAKAK